MNIDANGDNESRDEDRGGGEDGVLGEGQSSFQVGELKVDAGNAGQRDGGAGGGLQDPGLLPAQQQQLPPATAVCWERFLHVRSIRVLLVENDDSTRHVVSALLRNCNYEVLEAANGLQAWKILEDLTNHIDLVLTEVVMPYLPGIPLLNKIMSHKTRKNVPVIMMSSHDSMGLVFKCLSKGAVDFLVKPIRKNELKNLWQHVWRRCHSSSGSGSESGTQTQKSVRSKSSEKSDNSLSNDGENDGSDGLNVGDGSDDGSGAQSSWTKQAVEVDSSQAISPVDQVAECPDSTCAQVIRSNAENSGSQRVHIIVPRKSAETKCDTVAEDKDMDPNSKPMSQSDCNLINKLLDHGQPISKGECSFSKQKAGCGKMCNPSTDVIDSDSTRVKSMSEINNNKTDDSKEPTVELSLKRLRGEDTGRSVQDDRYVLRRSEQSAFSRYNSSSNTFKAPNGLTGSSTVIDNSVEVAKRESVGDMQTHSTDRLVYLSSVGVSNNIDMGSSTNKLPAHAPTMKDKSEATSTISGSNPSAFKPVKNDLRYSQQQASPLCNDMQIRDFGPGRGSHQEPQIQHSHHPNYHHHNFHNLEQPSCNHDEMTLQKLTADAPLCGSTNVLGGPVDGNHMNYSLNRSVSGSNNGSNGQNGSSTAVNATGNNGESDAGPAGKSGSGGDASGSGTGNRVDENRLEHRKAALHKYQKKKKERCFTKKVRYQNRKKLAEQRPRVRGQFVKQTGTDSSNRTSEE